MTAHRTLQLTQAPASHGMAEQPVQKRLRAILPHEASASSSLKNGLNELPVELLLEVCRHLTTGEDEGPRDPAASTFLHILMTTSRELRRVALPIYFEEVSVASKGQCARLLSMFRANKFKKTAAVKRPDIIKTLDLTLERTSEGHGGYEGDLRALASTLTSVKRLHVRMNEQVRLASSKPYAIDYVSLLSRFGCGGQGPSQLEHLSIVNTTTEPFAHVLQLLEKLPNLHTLLIDNVSSVPAHNLAPLPSISLPNLSSFTLRNAVDIVVAVQTGFGFLTRTEKLKKLSLRDARPDRDFLAHVLQQHQHRLVDLEIGTAAPAGTVDRNVLSKMHQAGTWSWDTGVYPPIEALKFSHRMGNEAAAACHSLSHLSVGGLFCVSPALLDVLQEDGRKPLTTLKLYNAWPMRPLRPTTDPLHTEEQEALAQNPSGIAPDDVLAALANGLELYRLELVGMGPEWDTTRQEKARAVQEECEQRGIAFVLR